MIFAVLDVSVIACHC